MDLSVEFTSFIKLPVIDRKSLNVENLLYVKNTFILFTSFYDKEKDNNSIYANLLDPLSGKLTATKEIGVIPATSARKKGSFSINFSTDSTKLLVTQESALNNENSTKIGFTVFDLQLKILWNKDFTLPFKDKNHYIGTTLLDKDGNLHILTQIFLEKEERGKDTPSYYYQVLSYFHSGDDLKNMT
jgi:hypothetical protein